MKNKKLLVLFSAVLIGLTGCGPTSSDSTSASSNQANSSQTTSSATSSSSSSSATPSSSSSTSSSSSASSSASSSSEGTVNYGTLEAPLTIEQAKALCDQLENKTLSENKIFVTGYVKSIESGSYGYTIWIGSTAEGTDKEFELYSTVMGENVVTPIVGSKVIVTGYYQKYNTTYELTYNKTEKHNPTVVWSDAKKEEIVINTIGSLEDPKTVAYAYEEIAKLTESTYTTSYYSNDKYYVKGIVMSVSVNTDNQYTLNIADSVSSTNVLNVRYASLANEVGAPKIGDDVIVLGHLQNYVGTYQMNGDNDTYVKPSVEKQVTGTTKYSVIASIVDGEGEASDKASISGLSEEDVLPNTELTFKVTVEDGYRASVSFNGSALVPDDEGNYKTPSYFKNEIVVTVTQKVAHDEKTVDLSIATIATANGWVNSTKYTTLPTGDDNLTITAVGTGNTGKYYSSSNGSWRFYSAGDGKMVISVADTHVIKSVTVTFKEGTLTFNGNDVTSGTAITIKELSTVELKATSNTQVTNIKVIYA